MLISVVTEINHDGEHCHNNCKFLDRIAGFVPHCILFNKTLWSCGALVKRCSICMSSNSSVPTITEQHEDFSTPISVRNKPVIEEAMKLTQNSLKSVCKWLTGHGLSFQADPFGAFITVALPDCCLVVHMEDWLVLKSVKGEKSPILHIVKSEIFEKEYECIDGTEIV